jgi:glycosyltransferase involved in cell wall biosynthesis
LTEAPGGPASTGPPDRSPGERPLLTLVVSRLNETGGAERSTVLLLEHLSARDLEVRVVVLGGTCTFGSRERLEADGVAFVSLRGGFAARSWALLRDLWRTTPDLVSTALFEPDMVGRVAAAIAGAPVVVTLTNMQYSPEAFAVARSPRRLEVVRRLDAAFGRHLTTAFHAVSAAVATYAVERLGARSEQVAVVHRGRDLAVFSAGDEAGAEVRRELGLAAEAPVVLNVARQEPQKGQDLLLDAFARVHAERPDAVLLVAGRDGTCTPALRAQLARHGFGSAVRFLGVRADVPALLSAADVLVSSSRFEGVAGAVLEAMVAGVPVAGFDIAPVREVTAGNAALVPLGDTGALAETLLGLLEDPTRRQSIAAAARTHALEAFSLERYGRDMAALYQAVIEDPIRYRRPRATRGAAWLRRRPARR